MTTTFKFEETSKFIENLNNLISLYKDSIGEEFQKDKNNFMVKYVNKICLKRLSIAIFGKKNSGKSTFLNLILDLKDFLEIKNDSKTKFIFIIRHKSINKNPEVFEANPEERKTIEGNVDYVNFIKGKKIEGNINEIISKRNKEINDIKNKNEIIREKMKYFLIIEANLAIFNEPSLEKYADLFEFLDIPGIDEENLNNDVYFKDLIPVIIPNVVFSIFIFDSKSIEDNNSSNIISLMSSKIIEKQTEKLNKELRNEFLYNIEEKMVSNSIYIINKIDEERIHKKDEYIEIARNLLLNIFNKRNYIYNIDNFNIFALSAKNLLLEQYSNKNFNPDNITKRQINNKIIKELYELFYKIISKIIDDFNNTENFRNLFNYLNYKNCNLSIYSQNLIKKYDCISEPLKILEEPYNNFKEELNKMNDFPIAKSILIDFEKNRKIFYNRQFLNYLLLGKYSLGKSHLINTVIIGKKILPENENECSRIGIILNHIDDINESALYKVNPKQYEEDQNIFYYFEHDETAILEKGVVNIKNKLEMYYEKIRGIQLEFYLIKIPLKLFDFIDEENKIGDLKYKIQLIDYPDLNFKIFQEFIINGILFTNIAKTLNDKETNIILKELLCDIRLRNHFKFSLKNCLFVIISERDKDVVSFRKNLNKIIKEIQNSLPDAIYLKNPSYELKNEDIQIIKFSHHFTQYLEDYQSVKNDDIFINTIKKIENDKKLKEYYEKMKDKIKLPEKYEIPKENKKNNILSKIQKNLISLKITENAKMIYLEGIAKYYYYIINNPTELNFYKSSSVNDFKNYLNNLLDINNYYQKPLKLAIAKYFEYLGEIFIRLKYDLSKKINEIDKEYFNKKNERNIINKLDDIINNEKIKIKNKFLECKEKIKICISKLKDHLNNTIFYYIYDFQKKENDILEEANVIYRFNNYEIYYILNYISGNYKYIISNILKHTKKNFENKVYNSKNMNTCDEFNYFDELNITSIKIIRERKIECKKEIDRVENKIIKKIDDNLNKIINQVNLKRENYVNIIQEIFKNNIEESEKNSNNYDKIEKIITNLEDFLREFFYSTI